MWAGNRDTYSGSPFRRVFSTDFAWRWCQSKDLDYNPLWGAFLPLWLDSGRPHQLQNPVPGKGKWDNVWKLGKWLEKLTNFRKLAKRIAGLSLKAHIEELLVPFACVIFRLEWRKCFCCLSILNILSHGLWANKTFKHKFTGRMSVIQLLVGWRVFWGSCTPDHNSKARKAHYSELSLGGHTPVAYRRRYKRNRVQLKLYYFFSLCCTGFTCTHRYSRYILDL